MNDRLGSVVQAALVAYSCLTSMEAREGLPAAEDDCGTPRSQSTAVVVEWEAHVQTRQTRSEQRQLQALEDSNCVSAVTMLSHMPFVNEYWPYIVAGVICYLGARFLYHSAVSWNPNPGGAQSYETRDKGTLTEHHRSITFQ
jgi:hypothetical protein